VDNLTVVGSGSAAAETKKQRTYTVKSGDTLWGIAKKELGSGSRYPEIVKLNGLKTNTIYSGQILKLPSK
jgi:nucleoid-associated protein YgaU